jgi:Flp pilus assembly pilin Flp
MKKIIIKKQKGQGVVEYAGALVIAAVVVASVLAVGPGALAGMFQDITTKISNYFQDQAVTAQPPA